MNAHCDDVKTLLTSYLDGELSEAQAAPVRAHLLACTGCRETVQEGKVVRRWLRGGAGEPVEVPPGFAARVARRAFAGDPGLVEPRSRDVEPAARPLLPFLLQLTAAAAILLLALALLLRSQTLPEGESLQAEDRFWEGDPPPARVDLPAHLAEEAEEEPEPAFPEVGR